MDAYRKAARSDPLEWTREQLEQLYHTPHDIKHLVLADGTLTVVGEELFAGLNGVTYERVRPEVLRLWETSPLTLKEFADLHGLRKSNLRRYAHDDHTLSALGQDLVKAKLSRKSPDQIAAQIASYQQSVLAGNQNWAEYRPLAHFINIGGRLTVSGQELFKRIKGEQFNPISKIHLEEWKVTDLSADEFIALHGIKKTRFQHLARSNHTLTLKGEKFLAAEEPSTGALRSADEPCVGGADAHPNELEARLQFFEEMETSRRNLVRRDSTNLESSNLAAERTNLPELSVDEIDACLAF